MNDTVLHITGNLTADPELRFTSSGAAVVNFTIASTPRTFNKERNDWEDGDPLFMRCSAWRQLAENVAESLTKGSRVTVEGKLKQRSYETKEGEKRTVVELDAYEVAASVRFAKVTIARTNGGGVNPSHDTAPQTASVPAAPTDAFDTDEAPF